MRVKSDLFYGIKITFYKYHGIEKICRTCFITNKKI